MNNLSQISFFADEVSPVSKNYNDRNDVRTGECGVNLTVSVLQSWNIHAFQPATDSAYDIVADYEDLMIKIQVKSRRQTSEKIKFIFTRGYHASQTGVYDYKANDFDISACVSIPDRKVIFSYGVKRYLTWPRKQFNLPGAEFNSWNNAFNLLKKNRSMWWDQKL